MEIPKKFVAFKPLKEVEVNKEQPQIVVLLTNPDQISALVVLANYGRKGNENVIIPYTAGCETMSVFAYKEARSNNPRAIMFYIFGLLY